MRDRALSIGAILNIDSEPGEGTRVFLKLPPLVLSPEVMAPVVMSDEVMAPVVMAPVVIAPVVIADKG